MRPAAYEDRIWRILAIFLLLSVVGLVQLSKGFKVCAPGPTLEVCKTAQNIWLGRSLSDPSYEQLSSRLKHESLNSTDTLWQDVFSIGADGHTVPKHPILLSAIAAPFVGIAGEFGAWLLNQFFIIFILEVAREFIRRIVSPLAASMTQLALIFGTQLLFMSFDLSYDLLAVAIIIAALAVNVSIPFLSSFFFCLVILIRPIFLIITLSFFIYSYFYAHQNILSKTLGFLLGLFVVGTYNWYFWGSPLGTPYENAAFFRSGEMITLSNHHYLSWEILFHDWGKKLFGSSVGLITYNAGILLAVPAFLIAQESNYYRELNYIFVIAMVLVGLVFSYSHWDSSAYGNRFLLLSSISLVSLGSLTIDKVIVFLKRIKD